MASYGDSFTCLYVDDVRASQETPTDLNCLLRRWLYFLQVDDVDDVRAKYCTTFL
jgi:hypothetical protein